jgi:ABC-2 type transport system ATP-binding protein
VARTGELAVDARGLVRRYRRGLRHLGQSHTAVDGVDLAIPAGTVFGLLGPNGAGKTTTIQMLLGLVRPTSGEVRIFGGDVSRASTREYIGYVPEKFELPSFLSARAFLRLHLQLQGTVDRGEVDREIDRVLEQLSLLDRGDDPLSTFSKGMQQRVAIAQAVLGSPRLVVLDEPTSALDPIGRRDVRDLVRGLRDAGTTVLLNSHLLAEVEQQCDDVVILERGRVIGHHAVGEASSERIQVRARIADATPELRDRLARLATDLQVVDLDEPDRVELAFTIAGEDEVGFVAEEVVAAGAVLLGLSVERESLEDLFMRVVGTPGAATTSADSEVKA